MADGADRQTAHDGALKEFGNVTLTTEAARRVWTPRWLEALRDQVNDIRYVIRALAKSPGFSVTVVAVLTLGIGLNAAVFAMLKGIGFSPIAGVDGSTRLAVVYGVTSAGREVGVSYPDYQDLRDPESQSAGPPHGWRADPVPPDGGDAVRLRRRGHRAGDARHLRAGVLHRPPEHARNRHPHGPGRHRPPRSSGASWGAACWLGAAGAAVGLAAALGVGRLVGSALYGVSATDVVSFARALTIVLGGVVVATLVPAWRASRTESAGRALRHD